MSNRLRFRFWDIDQKKMFGDWYCDDDLEVCDGKLIVRRYTGSENSMTGQHIEDVNSVLMQCTGLKDKNGVLIFEGDILLCTQENGYTGALEKVEFNNGMFHCRHRVISIHELRLDQEIEIIGNIYEHQHLLEPT